MEVRHHVGHRIDLVFGYRHRQNRRRYGHGHNHIVDGIRGQSHRRIGIQWFLLGEVWFPTCMRRMNHNLGHWFHQRMKCMSWHNRLCSLDGQGMTCRLGSEGGDGHLCQSPLEHDRAYRLSLIHCSSFCLYEVQIPIRGQNQGWIRGWIRSQIGVWPAKISNLFPEATAAAMTALKSFILKNWLFEDFC